MKNKAHTTTEINSEKLFTKHLSFASFIKSQDGATALEFALISSPFIVLFLSILQISLVYWVGQNLDDALQKGVRVLYTGSFQVEQKSQKDPATLLSALQNKICSSGVAFDCANLKLDVSVASSFASGAIPTALDEFTKNWASGFGSKYACAKPGSIIVVTAALKYPVALTFINLGAATFADGSRLIQSTVVMRSEPYDVSSGSAC